MILNFYKTNKPQLLYTHYSKKIFPKVLDLDMENKKHLVMFTIGNLDSCKFRLEFYI